MQNFIIPEFRTQKELLAKKHESELLKSFSRGQLAAIKNTSEVYHNETLAFLYHNHFIKRNKTMKFSCRVTAFTENLVARDYFITMSNMLKTFFLTQTNLLKFYRSLTVTPLSASAMAKRRCSDIFFSYPDFLYHTGSDMMFRNVTIKVDLREKRILIPLFNKLVRPLNKALFYMLFDKLNRISLRDPLHVTYKFYKNYKFSVWYLGIKLKFYNHYLSIRHSFLKKYLFALGKFKYQLKRKKILLYVIYFVKDLSDLLFEKNS